jgi:hypothetical protein
LIFSFTVANCQVLDSSLAGKSNKEIANYYLQKSKNNNTSGWLLAAAGAVVCYSGFSYAMNHFFEKENQSTVLFCTGLGVGLSSIFAFNAAAKHKRTATLYLKKDPNVIPITQTRNLNLTLSLPLSR